MKTESDVKKCSFALILSDKTKISRHDIERIITEHGITPIFISASGDTVKISRLYARIFDAELIKPSSFPEFKAAVSRAVFSVCDNARGAVFSLCSGIPTYADIRDGKCRLLAGKLAAFGCPYGMYIPYTKSKTEEIKEVGARGSDFGKIIKDIMKKIVLDYRERGKAQITFPMHRTHRLP